VSGDPALDRVENALADLGAEHVPPAGWDDQVLAAVRRHRKRKVVAAAVMVAAAAVVAWWALSGRGSPPGRFELALLLERGGKVVRGTSANLGDTLRATARGGRHRAIWIYRGEGELMVACPGGDRCRSSEGEVSADALLRGVGTYAVVALAADGPLEPPHGALDEAVAAAAMGGAQYRIERLTVY
jgi:hypothetical protein